MLILVTGVGTFGQLGLASVESQGQVEVWFDGSVPRSMSQSHI